MFKSSFKRQALAGAAAAAVALTLVASPRAAVAGLCAVGGLARRRHGGGR